MGKSGLLFSPGASSFSFSIERVTKKSGINATRIATFAQSGTV